MLQPSSYHYWYRYHPKTGKRETYTYSLGKFILFPDIRFFRKDGTQRNSITIKGNRYYKE